MKIGNMRSRVEIMEYTDARNENGFDERTWNVVNTVWAWVENEKRYKETILEKDNSTQTYYIHIRYVKNIHQQMRIRFQNTDFEIVSIEDKEFRQRELILAVKQVV